jgi:membrane-associated phospholipid phosphatase
MNESLNQVEKKRNVRLWLAHDRAVTKILLSIALGLVFFLVGIVFFYGINSFDQAVLDGIKPHITENRTRIMRFISFLGKHSFLLPVIGILLTYFIIRKKKWLAIRTAVVLLSSLLLMSLLKRLIHRQRPADPLVEGITNFSFPSGHAFMSVAFYGLLIWLSAHYIRNKWLQRAVNTSLVLIILLIGFSRIYLRVHYATDVIAGLSIGFVWLSFCLWIVDKKEPVSAMQPV